MAVYGYIFLSVSRDLQMTLGDQQRLISDYAGRLGLAVGEVVIEQGVSLKKPFRDRPEGAKLLHGLEPGDVIIAVQAAWILASAKEGARLMRALKKRAISLYCVDVEENLSMPSERRLMVTEGAADLVQKLLDALAVCESSRHGDAIRATKRERKRQGKYLGGPVPFGWQVSKEGFLEPQPQEQEVIEEIRRLREDRWSYRDISIKLKDKFDIKLSHEGIRRILTSDRGKKEAAPARRGG